MRLIVALKPACFSALLICAFAGLVPFFLPGMNATAEFPEPLKDQEEAVPPLDKAAYDAKLRALANLPADAPAEGALWPVSAAYPEAGAVLPFNRIVAYYGNFLSKQMGVLGQYPEEVMLEKLAGEVKRWKEADPETPVLPAIDYIAVAAQAAPGKDGKYRYRMSDREVQKALELGRKIDGIVILEVQAGLADLLGEVRALEPYLSLKNVHLAIDPEFAMAKYGKRPGTAVGTVDAQEINAIAEFLASVAAANGLPPKVLIIHRYTEAMITNAGKIVPLPQVQIVMDMDGWGPPSQKLGTYEVYIRLKPVQFTGFKLFYKNDLFRSGSRLMTPEEILKLSPQPSFIQYQ